MSIRALVIFAFCWCQGMHAERTNVAAFVRAHQEAEAAIVRSRTAGPPFDHLVFPSFLEPLTRKDAALVPDCGKSFEAVVSVKPDSKLHTKMVRHPERFFDAAFVFEGENVYCGSGYKKTNHDADGCKAACAEDPSCTAFVVFTEATKTLGAFSCGPCFLYNKHIDRNCAPEFHVATSCDGEFIGAYSKAAYLQSGEAFLDAALPKTTRGFPIAKGLKLIRIGSHRMVSREALSPLNPFGATETEEHRGWVMDLIERKIAANVAVEVAFEAGVDFRGCWGNLNDALAKPVCSEERLDELMQDMLNPSNTPEKDNAGQSGSTLITNYKNFIIKNVMDDHEFQLLRESMPRFKQSFSDRAARSQNCFRTAIAPICVVMCEEDTKWMFMRQIALPEGAKRLSFRNSKHDIKWFDVKGPYFTGTMDGKSHFQRYGLYRPDGFWSQQKGWKHKDPGFVQLFPKGLKLKACGCRDAAATLAFDTHMLSELAMTDYSLYGAFYESPIEHPSMSDCLCGRTESPTFPMVLEVKPDGIPLRKNGMSFYVALGIIDYIEQRVNDGTWSHFSTMKEAGVYREYFMRMWPKYFRVPPRRFTCSGRFDDGSCRQGELADDGPGKPAEQLQLGMEVMALTKIKWGKTRHSPRPLVLPPETHQYYFSQMVLSEYSSSAVGSSKFKVIAGSKGRIVRFIAKDVSPEREANLLGDSTDAIIVKWDDVNTEEGEEDGKSKFGNTAFKVEPNQIIGLERRLSSSGGGRSHGLFGG